MTSRRLRRWLRFIWRLLLHAVVIGGAVTVLAWLVGRLMSDRAAWSQWLHWIPTPTMAPVLLVMLAAAMGLGPPPRWRRPRVRVVLVATAIIAVYFTGFEHRLLRRPAATNGSVELVNWHLSFSRTKEDRAPTVARCLDVMGDVTVFVDGQDVRRHVLNELPPEMDGVITGRFTVVSRLPIIEARQIVDNEMIDVVRYVIDTTDRLGRPLVVHAIDLPSDPRYSRMQTADEVRMLVNAAGESPADVIMGDFNIPRGSASLLRGFPGYHHAFDDGGHGYAGSFHRRLPLFHIDHVLLAEDLLCSRYDLVDPGMGRHLLQRAAVRIRGE